MKPYVNQNTRFNLFDALILLLVAGLLVAGVLYLIPARTQGDSALVTVSFKGVRADLAALLKEGDIVYDQSGNTTLGKIESVLVHRDSLTLPDPVTGEEQTALYPENTLCAVTLTINVPSAAAEGDLIRVGTLDIEEGSSLSVRTARVSLVGMTDIITLGGQAA